MPSYYRDPEAPTPNVPRRVGVTALIERDGAFLVERRVDDPDRWAFVGGTLEENEHVSRRWSTKCVKRPVSRSSKPS